MRKDASAAITRKERWGEYVCLTLESPDIAREAVPGQFVMVRVADGVNPLLRRPLGIHGRNAGSISLFFSIAGPGTRLLSEKKEGEALDVLGPLGRGFAVGTPGGDDETAALVGGGRGIAPLHFLAVELHRAGYKVKILYGGRTEQDLPLRKLFGASCWETSFSTDDGSFGRHGLVTDLLRTELDKRTIGRICACGPDPMLREVGRLAMRDKVPAELSLEARMGCGFGACWGCVRKIRRAGREEWLKVCEDGPVFPAEEVVWD